MSLSSHTNVDIRDHDYLANFSFCFLPNSSLTLIPPITATLTHRTDVASNTLKTKTKQKKARFQLIAAVTVKNTVFSDETPYSLVEIYQRFGGAC
jgi:hypothetical protein